MTDTARFTAEQVVQIIETPLGRRPILDDDLGLVVVQERKKVHEKYKELKTTPRWFPPEELKHYPGHADKPGGAMLIPDFSECLIGARAWWLRENVKGLRKTGRTTS